MKKTGEAALSAVLLSTLMVAEAVANENVPQETLEEVHVSGQLTRYSATKSDVPIMETSRSISIETQQLMLDKGVLNLDDAYTYTSGVIGETYGFATRGDWVKVRGLDVPQYQDSLQSLFGNYNNTRPDIYTLEQVEILKGPASVLYGKGSPGGIVNVISKRPQVESRHEVVAEVGNFERQQLAFDSTGKLSESGEWLYRMVAVYRDSDTQVDFVDDQTQVLAPSISWRPSDVTDVTVLLNYTKKKGDTAAQFLPIYGTLLPAPNGKYLDSSVYLGEPDYNLYDAETTSLTLLANHQFNDVWSVEFTSRYTDGKANYQQAWPTFSLTETRYLPHAETGEPVLARSFYRSDAKSQQLATDVRFKAFFDTGSIEHKILIGAQYQDVTTDDDGYYAYAAGLVSVPELGNNFWIDPFNPSYGNVPDLDSLNALYEDELETKSRDSGLYIHDQMTVNRLHISLGLRYDESDTDAPEASLKDDAFSASVGFLYEFEQGVSPYVSYAQSFEPVVADNGAGQPLEPQEGEQWELGVKYQPSNIPVTVTMAYFDIEQSNLDDPDSRAGELQQQSGIAKIDGIEIEAQAKLGDFAIELNASKLNTKNPNGFQFASVPEKQASTWVSYRPTDRWQGFKSGVGVRYVGASYDSKDIHQTPSYTLADLMLGYEIQHWDFSLNVRNLTNKEYLATCLSRGDCYVGDERTVVGKVRYIF